MRYYGDTKQDRAQEARLEAVDPEPRLVVVDKARALAIAQAVVDWLYDTGDCLFCSVQKGADGQYVHEDFCPLLGLQEQPDYAGVLAEIGVQG